VYSPLTSVYRPAAARPLVAVLVGALVVAGGLFLLAVWLAAPSVVPARGAPEPAGRCA
jgi:hypothetical protein